jgi:hypothetical protein
MKIILGTFKDSGDELAEFLGPRLGAKLDVSGGELSVDDDSMKKTVNARDVKTYVKRFLWKKGERKNYRVLVQGKELRLIELEASEAEKEEQEEKEQKAKEEAKRQEQAEKEEKQQQKKEEVVAPAPKAEEPAVGEPKVETSVEQEKKPAIPKAPKEVKKGKKKDAAKEE